MQEIIYLDVTFCPVNHFITKMYNLFYYLFSLRAIKLTSTHFKMLIEKHLIFDWRLAD